MRLRLRPKPGITPPPSVDLTLAKAGEALRGQEFQHYPEGWRHLERVLERREYLVTKNFAGMERVPDGEVEREDLAPDEEVAERLRELVRFTQSRRTAADPDDKDVGELLGRCLQSLERYDGGH